MKKAKLETVENVAAQLERLGFDTKTIYGNTYRDLSVVAIVPTRGLIHPKVVQSWIGLSRPINQKFGMYFVAGDEVGVAYNRGIEFIIGHKDYGKFSYIMTLEDDNIVPASAVYLLLEAIGRGYDAVGGLYFMKNSMAVPMAFGVPDRMDEGGNLDMMPVDVTDALLAAEKNEPGAVIEVNGIACGCTLWSMDLFRKIDPPWFQTWTKFRDDGAVEVVSQDIDFCRKAKARGARFAVDTRCKVGHIDRETGTIY